MKNTAEYVTYIDDLYFFAITPREKVAIGSVFPHPYNNNENIDEFISIANDHVIKSIKSYGSGCLNLSCGLIRDKIDRFSLDCAQKFLINGEKSIQ